MERHSKGFYLAGISTGLLSFAMTAVAEDTPVYIAAQENNWQIGGSALYMQPNEGFTYATVQKETYDNVMFEQHLDTLNQTYTVNRDFDWGYDAFIRYNFEGADRDLLLNYMHFSSSDSSNVDLGELNSSYIYNQFTYTAEGSVDTNINMADLLAGQYVHFGEELKVHFVAGVTYARVKQKENVAYDKGLEATSADVLENYPLAQEAYESFDSTFNGVGPKFGIDGNYNINRSSFGLVGGISYALLYGTQEYSSQLQTSNGPGGPAHPVAPPFNVTTNDFDNNSVVVSNINANLGLRFVCDLANDGEESLDLELGYQVYQYLDVVYDEEDVSIAGPYLTAAVSF